MDVRITKVDVRDLNRPEINAEYCELEDIEDLPEGEALDYFNHEGHRIHMAFRSPTGEYVNLAPTEETFAALRVVEAEVNLLIVAAGAVTAEPNWRWSRHAGCSMCPCSPGWFVKGTGEEKRVWVDVVVTV